MKNTEIAIRPLHVVPRNSATLYALGGKAAAVTTAQSQDITERERDEEQVRTLSRQIIELLEEERRSIARALHDQIGTDLCVAKIMLDKATKSPPEMVASRLSEVTAQITETLQKVRNLSLDLSPSLIDDLDIIAVLIGLFDRLDKQSGLKIDFKYKITQAHFSPDIDITVYRVVQAALTNVIRHAGVATAKVRLLQKSSLLSVTVEDSGIGFDPDKVSFSLFTGISAIQERVRLLGGKSRIESSPGVGTRVMAEIPLPRSTTLSNFREVPK